MTTILQSFKYRNERDTATIWVEQYQDKDMAVPFWKIFYRYDGMLAGVHYKTMLKNKPRRAVIENLRADI